jgi:fructosamine-3-kinase
MSLWHHLSEHISRQTRVNFEINSHSPVGGGCINDAFKVSNGYTLYFVKLNDIAHHNMFKTEALSLQEMSEKGTVRVPRPICFGQTQTQAYLVLEYLNLSGRLDSEHFGQQLAAMHRVTTEQFGWITDNTIGATPQYNQQTPSWINFWREQRLQPQLALAEKNGYGSALSPLTNRLVADFEKLFETYTPQPSMLHGDLWGGNAAALSDGMAVIYDPALYYGDRETDIAMTYLFGGFDKRFYDAYQDAWPLDDGFAVRKTFYNLYHILNHLNLFGSGYLHQAVSMTEKVLSQI